MTPANLLREVKRRMLAGPASKTWMRDYGSPGGPRCVLGHVDDVIDDEYVAGRRMPDMVGRDELRRALGNKYGGSVSMFNDAQRSIWPILALINRAIEQSERKP